MSADVLVVTAVTGTATPAAAALTAVAIFGLAKDATGSATRVAGFLSTADGLLSESLEYDGTILGNDTIESVDTFLESDCGRAEESSRGFDREATGDIADPVKEDPLDGGGITVLAAAKEALAATAAVLAITGPVRADPLFLRCSCTCVTLDEDSYESERDDWPGDTWDDCAGDCLLECVGDAR